MMSDDFIRSSYLYAKLQLWRIYENDRVIE